MRSASVASLLFFLVISPSVAMAAEPSEASLAEAARHFKAGSKAFDIANFSKALSEFQLAAELMPAPQLDYNIGECYEQLGQLPEAIAAYQRFLAAAPDDPDAAKTRAHVATLKERLPPPPPPKVVAPPVAVAPPVKGPADTTPVYKKWWLWTAVAAVVVVGAGLGLGFGLGGGHAPPDSSLGSMSVTFQ